VHFRAHSIGKWPGIGLKIGPSFYPVVEGSAFQPMVGWIYWDDYGLNDGGADQAAYGAGCVMDGADGEGPKFQ
jgi:hypothetical protein